MLTLSSFVQYEVRKKQNKSKTWKYHLYIIMYSN